VAPATVRNQIYRAYRKLDVNNKAELVHRLQRV
jgi:DNA-binding CsgD family transcriptional regulator